MICSVHDLLEIALSEQHRLFSFTCCINRIFPPSKKGGKRDWCISCHDSLGGEDRVQVYIDTRRIAFLPVGFVPGARVIFYHICRAVSARAISCSLFRSACAHVEILPESPPCQLLRQPTTPERRFDYPLLQLPASHASDLVVFFMLVLDLQEYPCDVWPQCWIADPSCEEPYVSWVFPTN